MKQIELLSILNKIKLPFYTFAELQLILGLSKLSTNKRIIDLVNNGFLIKLGRNIFVPSFWEYNILDIVSNINVFSYISFEYALFYHKIINNFDNKLITLATLNASSKRQIGNYTVIYSKVNKDLFFGFQKIGNSMIAYPEKAYIDLIYMQFVGRAKFDNYDIDIDKFNTDRYYNLVDYLPVRFKNFILKNFNLK